MRAPFLLAAPDEVFRDSVRRFIVHALLAVMVLALVGGAAALVADSAFRQAPHQGDIDFARQLRSLERSTQAAEFQVQAYLLTSGRERQDAALAAVAAVGPRLRSVADAAADRPSKREIAALESVLHERLASLTRGLALRTAGDPRAIEATPPDPGAVAALFTAAHEAEEASLEAGSAGARNSMTIAVAVVLGGFSLIIAMLLIGSAYAVLNAWRRIRRIGLDPRAALAGRE